MRLPFWPFNLRAPWWVKIDTTLPVCTYYFGPFDSAHEAQQHQVGYVEDLLGEEAQGIALRLLRCEPTVLTHCQSTRHQLGLCDDPIADKV